MMVLFLFLKGGKDFGNRSSYLKPSSETELNNTHFNKASNKNNSKRDLDQIRAQLWGKTCWDTHSQIKDSSVF